MNNVQVEDLIHIQKLHTVCVALYEYAGIVGERPKTKENLYNIYADPCMTTFSDGKMRLETLMLEASENPHQASQIIRTLTLVADDFTSYIRSQAQQF